MTKTVALNNVVTEIEISGKENAIIRNLGNNVAYVSATPNISVGNDVIIAVKPGKTVTLEGVAAFKNCNGKYGVYGTIYAFSSGVTTIEIIAANKAKNGGNIFMYNDITIEKALYNLAGKNLTQALEQIDPSSQYAGTELATLDAYERQLRRFDIRTDIDTIDKFFGTKEAAVLFPEFVRRSIKQGFDDSPLSDITAADTRIHTRNYKPLAISESGIFYSTPTSEASTLNKTNLTESTTDVSLVKMGRLICTSYEVLMRQSIAEYALTLKTIGFKIANGMLSKAIAAIYNKAASINIEGSAIAYSDIINLYGQFSEFNMDAILVSPTVAAQILAMSPMESCTFDEKKRPVTPFGATVIKCPSQSAKYIIGLDTRYALEAITTSDIMVEIDRLIEKQIENIAVSVNVAFYPLNSEADKVLVIST